jgi:enoyl-CoA hydratase
MSNEHVVLRRDGEIAEIVLNRPEKQNALSRAMWLSIAQFAREAESDPQLRVLILRGASPQAFSAGADISEFKTVHGTPEAAKDYGEVVQGTYEAVANLNKPTIAMIAGNCFGGACALSLCCDFRYSDATGRFCIPPANLGIAYSFQETKRLADLVGLSKAKEMLFAARVVGAEEALRIGLIDQLFAPGEVESGTKAFARTLGEKSQFTIKAVKAYMRAIAGGADSETDDTRGFRKQAYANEDYKEGVRAFMEKRKPKFTYR